jgi:FkbM family methyltransferase
VRVINRAKSLFHKVIDLFPGKGVFVEFGAYDGATHSLAPHLVSRGWSGYFTEPIPEYFTRCCEHYLDRSDIVVDNVAIGASDGSLDMSVAETISSGSEVFREWSKTGRFQHLITGRQVRVEMMTLDHFFEKHDIPVGVELVVVDVEGMEWEVFKGFDIDKWRPRLMMVEIHRKLVDFPVGEHYKKVEEHLLDRGYEIVLQTGVNTLFYGS